jgi:2',3'-cyclic-nucleotide 2'-phosphodiesterase/3'-nucleotidase
MIRAPYYADQLIRQTKWFREFLTQAGEYGYYLMQYPAENGDDRPPGITAAPLVTHATSTKFDVAIQVSDSSEIKSVRAIKGIYDADYTGWGAVSQIKKGFTVRENGIYSIYAEDAYGNKSVVKITIDNFDPNLLSKPRVDTYTNRKTKISGTAEPGTTIVFEAYTGTYEGKVDMSGKFSYPLPAQPSDTLIEVYIKDESKGLVSERNTVRVKRTGPNQPTVNPVYNNANFINGSTNDSDAIIIAVIDDKVYVPEIEGKELYEANQEIYDKKLKVIETHAFVSDSYFLMVIPPQEAGKTITVYNIDHLSRNSRSAVVKVEEVAPNTPVVYEVCNIEKSLSGYVPGAKSRIYDVMLDTGNKTYKTKSDKNGKFSFKFSDQLYAGQILRVSAADTKDGKTRRSYEVQVEVKDIESFIRIDSDNLTLNRVTSESYIISGYYMDGGTVYLAIASGSEENFTNSLYILNTDDNFRFKHRLENKLEPGTYIYVMTRFSDGRILKANYGVVLPGIPDMPKPVREITNTDKLVEVIAEKDCEITLKIGSKRYTTNEYRYDEKTGNYIYSLNTDRDVSGTAVTVTAANAAGVSDAYKAKLLKAAPDAPAVNPVKAGDTTVTGTIELFEAPEQFVADNKDTKDAQASDNAMADNSAPSSLAAQRGVRIYAKVGSKTYEGVIYDNGYFSIKVPELSEGTTIRVWGTNRAGRGPLTKIKVAAK